MTADAQLASVQLSQLMKRIESSDDSLSSKLKQIYNDYPGDPGVFCLLLLNVITLEPGDALYMGPNDPHAYFKYDSLFGPFRGKLTMRVTIIIIIEEIALSVWLQVTM